MEVLSLQVFVSLMLVGGSILLFMHSVRQRDYDHADRLALLPMQKDDANASPVPSTDPSRPSEEPS
jgi:hypothetical protein